MLGAQAGIFFRQSQAYQKPVRNAVKVAILAMSMKEDRTP